LHVQYVRDGHGQTGWAHSRYLKLHDEIRDW
jgi:hypothetical protein